MRANPLLTSAIAVAIATLVSSGSEAQNRKAERDLSPALKPDERALVGEYTNLFGSKKDTLWPNHWLGIPTLQNPNDVWVTQEIITEIKPDLIVEAGTFRGGSAVLWAMVLEQINPAGRVITIDIEDQRGRRAKLLPVAKERIEFVLGSSVDPAVVRHVRERAEGKRVIVLLDSAHHRKHVLAELEAYAPIVPVGSYLIVQDTGGVMIGEPNPGPRQALDEFLAAHPEFVPDRTRERMLLTLHPKGYLRRVR